MLDHGERTLYVLAGGLGTRLRPAIGNSPKCLAPIGDKTFIEIQLEDWLSCGIRNFCFLLFYKHSLVKKTIESLWRTKGIDAKLSFVIEPRQLGTGGALLHALKVSGEENNFYVINADTWIPKAFVEFSECKTPGIGILKSPEEQRYGNIQINPATNTICSFSEKKYGEKADFINAGLYHLSRDFFASENKIEFSLETHTFPRKVKEHKLHYLMLSREFHDIGTPESYQSFLENWGTCT